jgi:hypothetical protein
VALLAGPVLGPVVKDGPGEDLDDIVVREIIGPPFAGLAKGSQDGDNCFPQLVFHEVLLVVMLQE